MWQVRWRREIKVLTSKHDAVGLLGRRMKKLQDPLMGRTVVAE